MKGIDTPLLLALLEGRPEAERLLEGQGEEELCTTEVNLFELEALARAGGRDGRARRLAALDRLRRKIGVLPIDERASRLAAQLASPSPASAPASAWLVLGALQAAGANELLTTDGVGWNGVRVGLRITVVRKSSSKKRKSRNT